MLNDLRRNVVVVAGWMAILSFSSPASEVIISELMYHPADGKPEYVELQNLTANPLDFARWQLTQGIAFTFPDFSETDPLRTFFKPFERILVASVDETALRAAYPSIPATVRVYGPYTNLLSNAGDAVGLEDKNGIELHAVHFDDRAPWPISADGAGHSLVAMHPDRVADDPASWRASSFPDGTPGTGPATPDSRQGQLYLSEIALSTSNTVSYAEVYNGGEVAIGATALWIASDRTLTNRVPLSGSVGPGGYASWDLDLPLQGGAATLYLFDGAGTVFDAVVADPHPTRAFAQTYPAGSAEWYSSSTGTRDAPNDPDRTDTIVINEIMADPLSEVRDGEYVELFNRGAASVDLDGWTLDTAVSYTFPPGALLGAGEYLVVAANRDYLLTTYGAVPCVGNYDGQLSNDGEHLRLLDREGNLADEVRYRFEGDWPYLARGLGSSLELVHPDLDNSQSSAWQDSDESAKASGKRFYLTGTYQNLNPDPNFFNDPASVNELHFFLVGDAHVALDSVEFYQSSGGGNLISNRDQLSSDGSSATGWLRQGTHEASYMDGGDLHLVADGHGDNKANRVEIDLAPLTPGLGYTISFNARWIYGKPRLIAQTWDHSVGDSVLVPPPAQLGTPGALNSRIRVTPPPLVEQLLHQPAVPTDNDPVIITTRVDSPDPLASVEVVHRVDNSSGNGTWVRSAMHDDGANGGDLTAGDGLYSARLTSHMVNGRIVQFYAEARTAAGETSVLPRQGAERPAMWVVDNRTIPSDLRIMRFVVSAYDRNALGSNGARAAFDYRFPRLSNHYFNMTLIAGEQDIYYGGEIRKSGSPWTRSGGSELDRGKWKIPRDRPFRGRTKFMFDNDASGGNREKNRMVRYWLYLFGHPANESEIVRHVINAEGHAIREEVEPVAQDLINRCFRDGGRGELFRIDDEWWFLDGGDDGNHRRSRDADWAYKNTEETLRYHTEWMARSRETDYDYTTFINWTEVLTEDAFSQADIERFADPVLMNIMAAVRGYIHDWDSLTLHRGKNGYFYRRPDDGRFVFLHWDSDLAFRSSDTGSAFLGGLPSVRNYYNKPYNRRLFDYYLGQIVDVYDQDSTRIRTWLQEETNATGSYDANAGSFLSWFALREDAARQEIGADYLAAFAITTGTGTSTTTPNTTLSLQGSAPTALFSVAVAQHPEAILTWTGKTQWRLEGIRLREGANALVVAGLDADGQILETLDFLANKTGNAPPIAELDSNPGSWNVGITDELVVDAGDSYDPESTPLTFAWDLSGPGDATLILNNDGDRATCRFPTPGLYTLTLTLTDGDTQQTATSRDVAVYNVGGFSSFTEPVLSSAWKKDNLALRNGDDLSAYYALRDRDGFLLLHVEEDFPKPLPAVRYQYPWLWRDLPADKDWLLQTKLKLETRQFGSFQTGLLIETLREGATDRYAFTLRDGNRLEMEEVADGGTRTVLHAVAWNGPEVAMRIRRTGDQLLFDARNPDDTWTTLHSQPLLPGTQGVRGGLFTATDAAESLRTAFDYAMLIEIDSTPSPYAGLRISEVMYDPPGGSDYEYLELVNLGVDPIDLSGLRFVDGKPFDELELGPYILAPGAHALVVNHTASMLARYGSGIASQIAGEWAGGRLSNSGEQITLVDPSQRVVVSFRYGVDGRWPSRAADEGGSSLEVLDPVGDLEDPANWRAGTEYLGSPGAAGAEPRDDVVVNELLTHTDPPAVDSIELHNTTAGPMAVGNWYLSDSTANYRKYRIPAGTVIPANGFVTFDETHFNPNGEWNPNPGVPGPNEFGLSSKGDEVILVEADPAGELIRFVDHEEFDAAENGVSFGRYLNSLGTEYLPRQLATSTGDTNVGPRVGPVVISEIMYHPLGGGLEFVELQNISDQPVPLFNSGSPSNTWQIAGIAYSFPEAITLGPFEIILLSEGDPAVFRAAGNVPPFIRILGPFPGILQNDGETLRVLAPDNPDPGDPELPLIALDTVRYEVFSPWPVEPNGLGPSLERVDVTAFAQDPANWRNSPVLGGTPGTTTLPPTTPMIQPDLFELRLTAAEFSNPPDRVIAIRNGGIGTLNFTVNDDAEWLMVTPATGSSSGTNETVSLILSMASAGLPGGQYSVNITLTDPQAANSPMEIPVILDIQEPFIQVSDAALHRVVHLGQSADPLMFDVFNGGEQITLLNYIVTDDAAWMEVTPRVGTSADESSAVTHTTLLSTHGLDLGRYDSIITVTDRLGSAPNSPVTIPMRLDVVQVGAEPHPPTGVGIGVATLNGLLTNTFNQATIVRFYIGAEDGGTDPAAWDTVVSAGSYTTDGPVEGSLRGMLYGVPYRYRIHVQNAWGESWSTRAGTLLTESPSVVAARGLRVRTYDSDYGPSLINPIANLLARPPTGEHTFNGPSPLWYQEFSEFLAVCPSLTGENRFTVLWEGVFDIGPDDVGTWTLGTISDDGSMWYIDFNRDGDYADAGEAVVDNNGSHAPTIRTANATFDEPGCYPTAMPMYEDRGGEYMGLILGKGANLPLESLRFLDATPGSGQPLRQSCGTSAILLENAYADQVFDSTADVHASFMGPGSVFTVSVLYGPTDGGRNEAAWEQRHTVGTFTNVASIQVDTTLNGLLPESTYYYTFQAHNAVELRWAEPNSLSFVTPERPHLVSILSLQLGSPVVVESTGADGWDVSAEYSTDDLGQDTPLTWQPLPILSNTYSEGVNTTSLPLPPADPERYILRLRNTSSAP